MYTGGSHVGAPPFSLGEILGGNFLGDSWGEFWEEIPERPTTIKIGCYNTWRKDRTNSIDLFCGYYVRMGRTLQEMASKYQR